MTPHILFGPPGTGKTTRLLSLVEDALASGIPPGNIAFVAFTKKAANEAKARAIERFKLNEDELPWFRTLHSLAFRRLNLKKNDVMGRRDYLKLAEMLGLSLSFREIREDGTFQGSTVGDRLFFMEMMSRTRITNLEAYWSANPDEDLNWLELERLQKTLQNYKSEMGKLDFTDMIRRFVDDKAICPEFDVLFVDEAQDLTRLQWMMVDRLIDNSREVHIAGDDDQAIFRWAGADVDYFIDLKGNNEVLPQSYRVPAEIMQVAHAIISRVDKRIKKEWRSRDALGMVEYVTGLEQIDMSQGTWLMLARNVVILQQFIDHCMMMGYVFDSQLESAVKGSDYDAIVNWERMRRGDPITGRAVKNIYDLISTREGIAYGYKQVIDRLGDGELFSKEQLVKDYGLLCPQKIWHEALDRLSVESMEYYLTALRRGEKLLKTPRIKISTIHGAKGGEAENVVLCPDMVYRTYLEYQKNPDDEHRVWYVAVTRAKERLFIMQPQMHLYYEL